MKIRIQVPSDLLSGYGSSSKVSDYIDDILLWGMETELDVQFYKKYMVPTEGKYNNNGDLFVVFTVEPVGAMMFSLRWGALTHKNKIKEKT